MSHQIDSGVTGGDSSFSSAIGCSAFFIGGNFIILSFPRLVSIVSTCFPFTGECNCCRRGDRHFCANLDSLLLVLILFGRGALYYAWDGPPSEVGADAPSEGCTFPPSETGAIALLLGGSMPGVLFLVFCPRTLGALCSYYGPVGVLDVYGAVGAVMVSAPVFCVKIFVRLFNASLCLPGCFVALLVSRCTAWVSAWARRLASSIGVSNGISQCWG